MGEEYNGLLGTALSGAGLMFMRNPESKPVLTLGYLWRASICFDELERSRDNVFTLAHELGHSYIVC
jgi:hypothetical protein